MKIIYPGSFNPWHAGHQYVHDFACRMAGQENVYVGIAKNPGKTTVDPEWVQWTMAPANLNVSVLDGATVDVCAKLGIRYMIRGIRPSYDLPQEANLDFWNKKLSGGKIETFFVLTPGEMDHLSSSAIRMAIDLGHDEAIAGFVDPHILARWKRKTIPNKFIYFGKSCIGKTTFFQRSGINAVECDKTVWKYFTENEKYSFKDYMKCAMVGRDRQQFELLIENIAGRIDWKDFLNPDYNYDAPALGVYFKHIDPNILANFKLVRMYLNPVDELVRLSYAQKKGLDKVLPHLDWAYQDSPFYDEEVML